MSESLPITTDIAVSLQESSSHEHTTMCQRVTDFFLSLCSWARVTSPNQDLNSHEATEALIPVNISALDYGARDDTSTPTAALGGGEGEGSCPRQDKPGDTMGSGVDSSILLPRPRGDQPPPSTCVSSTLTSPEVHASGHRRNRQTIIDFSGIPTPTVSDVCSDDEYLNRMARDDESDKVSSGSSGTSEKLERMREEGRRRVLARKLEQEKMIENNNPAPTTTQ